MKRLVHIIFLILLCTTFVYSQDLEQIGKKDGIKVNGSLAVTNIFYTQQGLPQNRRDPYAWMLNGSVNFDIYGWSVPLSFTLSQQSKSFNQPFNQYGLSPKYKWLTLHAGYRNMTFSPYTLSGHTFLGGGAEANFDHWKFAVMYGRLLKGISEDTLSTELITPSFERYGWGWKAEYTNEGSTVGINMFKAQDNINSINYIPIQNDVLPGENLAFGASFKTQIAKALSLQGDYGNSAYTRDIQSEEIDQQKSIYANVGKLFTYRNSTSVYHAFKTGLTYSFTKHSVGLNFERIDPGYQTMGSYFFNNDVENITVNTNSRLFKEKVTLTLSVGSQRNNIKSTETNTIKRLIGSANVSFNPTKKINFSTAYSNFQTSTAIEQRIAQFQNNDSLRFYQVSQSLNANIGYNTGSKDKKKGINLSLAYQTAQNEQQADTTDNTSNFYNGNLAYRYSHVPKQYGLSAGVNVNNSDMAGIRGLTIGPMISGNKTYFKKIVKSTLTSSFSNVYTNGINNSRVLTVSFNNSIVLKKRHNFAINTSYIYRISNTGTSQKFSELTTTVTYSISF